MEIAKEDLKKQTAEIKRHNDVLYEKFRNDIKIIGEGWDGTDEKVDKLAAEFKTTNEKVDATFGIVGQINIKVTDLQLRVGRLEKSVIQIRKDVEIMKSDISFIKNELKQKVNRDEFVALEKRLILLENKFKRV